MTDDPKEIAFYRCHRCLRFFEDFAILDVVWCPYCDRRKEVER